MKRGELYRVRKLNADPKRFRIFAVISRQVLIDSKFSTVICAPVFSTGQGLSTQVAVGPEEGLKHPSWIVCDNLISLPKSELTQFVGTLSRPKMFQLNRALIMALEIL
jgi:mRNA interferase MazF